MPAIAILGALILVPIILLMVLRVNAALVFLSLCLGDVLQQYLAPDASSLLRVFSARVPNTASVTSTNLKLILLLTPVVLTTLFMLKTVHKGVGLIFNALPAAGVGLLLALLVVPLLSPSQTLKIVDSSPWEQIQRAQDLVVGVSAVVCLVAIISLRPKRHSEERSSKKHKD